MDTPATSPTETGPPRLGPEGISEEETRAWAAENADEMLVRVDSPFTETPRYKWSAQERLMIRTCQEVEAKWDAEANQ